MIDFELKKLIDKTWNDMPPVNHARFKIVKQKINSGKFTADDIVELQLLTIKITVYQNQQFSQ